MAETKIIGALVPIEQAEWLEKEAEKKMLKVSDILRHLIRDAQEKQAAKSKRIHEEEK